jgi:S-adenosylhomocysteine hydrolase
MSRFYEMFVRVESPRNIEAIKDACDGFWEFPPEDWNSHGEVWHVLAQGNLVAGVTEEQFCKELAERIWEANGGYCKVEVQATYLEDLPKETYTFDEEDFGATR